jgi:hypothetical protein
MSLSERLRDVEAAPWVIKEIKKLEARIADLEKDEKMFLNEHDENVRLHFENVDLKEQNTRLREALEHYANEHGDFCTSWAFPEIQIGDRPCDCRQARIARAALGGQNER